MRLVFKILFFVLLGLALVCALNGGEYLGITGILQKLSALDFSFIDTTSKILDIFNSFSSISSGNILEVVLNATQGLFDLVRLPFVALKELIDYVLAIFDLLFSIVGAF